jgi:NAD(P)H-dependent FMN reductase
MNKLFIPIIQGTTRPNRRSANVSKLILEVSKEYDNLETVLVDPNDLNLPYDGRDPETKDPKYTEITAKADGFFIVVPEYNHSYPGSLKRMLDSEFDNYEHKAVAFAGVSTSELGGARAIEALLPVVRAMKLVAIVTDVRFPKVKELFDEQGNLTDQDYIKRIKKSFDELIWMAEALKAKRSSR